MAESAPYSLRGFDGNAAATTLSSSISNSATTIPGVNLASWSGFSGSAPGCATIDRGLSTEEKIEFTGVSGGDLSGVTRGVDGTSAVAHSAGATLEHTLRARDADEANLAVVKTIGQVSAIGDLLVGDAANSLDALPVGANDSILMVDTAQALKLKWAGPAGTADITDPSFTSESGGSADTWTRGDHLHRLPVAVPQGVLGGKEVAANQNDITAEADLTNLSVQVTVGNSRRIKITGYGRFGGSTANTGGVLRIKESTTELQRCGIPRQSTIQVGATIVRTLEPTTGLHTYKLTLAADSSDGGNIDLIASSDAPAFILVEDIGPAGLFS